MMFTGEERESIRERLIERARQDPKIVAAAAVGSSATGGDGWSDLDLTFGVAAGSTVAEALAGWTPYVSAEFGAAVLFDLPLHTTVYRVFLFPGALQVDLSFTPIAGFAPRGPRFRLIFGETAEAEWPSPARYDPAYDLGLAVHHLVRTNVCIERGRLWQAEYWLHDARNVALTLACHRLGLDTHYARGFDGLPPEVVVPLAGSFAGTLDAGEIRRALAVVTNALLGEADHIPQSDPRIRAIIESAGFTTEHHV